MVWEEIDDNIVDLERDFLGLLQDMESKDLISKEALSLQEENGKLLKQIEMLNKESEKLALELGKEMKIHDNLKNNYDMLQENIVKKEMICLGFQNTMEINERDSLRLKKAKEQFHVGKDFTGIRWDYSAPPNLCKGYIVNKSKKTIDTFELDKEKHSEEKIREFLWSLIEKHTSVDWSDLVNSCNGEDKENKKLN